MPDPTPDLVALADQVKFLSGDLNRRFELLSNSLNQLNSRMDALSTRMDTLSISRKVALPLHATLGGDWLEGTTSPPLIQPSSPPFDVVTAGRMAIVLPNLSRIGTFRASARISDPALAGVATLDISLQRTITDRDNTEMVVPLSCPLVPGIADPQGDPIPGKEFVDNDRFEYFISAVFSISGFFFAIGPPAALPPGKVVFETFEIDCIVA